MRENILTVIAFCNDGHAHDDGACHIDCADKPESHGISSFASGLSAQAIWQAPSSGA